MRDDETRPFQGLGAPPAIPINNRVDAQCVTEAYPGNFPKTGDSSQVLKLVGGNRIHHKSEDLITALPSGFVGEGSGQSASKVGCVFSLSASSGIRQHGFVHAIGSPGEGPKQSAPSHNGRQVLKSQIL
jgi:hypothetical protein